MKKLLILLTILASIMTTYAQMPPLIEREVFFGDPEISGAQISPDGNYITFIKPFDGVRNIWVKERNAKFEEAKPLTNDRNRPVTSYFWSRNSRYVLFVQDKGGDENFRVYAVDPKASGNPVPDAMDLTPYEGIRAIIYDVPKNDPDKIIVGLNDRNPQLHDVYKISLTTGERSLIRENNDNVAGWDFDLNGDLRLGVRQTEDGGTEILKVTESGLEQIYAVNNEESAGVVRFFPDGKRVYMITNKGADRDITELVEFNLDTQEIKSIEKDPENEVDFGGAVFSDITNELVATAYVGDRVRVYPKNKEFASHYENLKKILPEGELSITSQTEDEKIWLVAVSRDVDPGSVYVYDLEKGKADLLYKSRPNLPSENLAPMKPIRYKSKDGLVIPAYLTLPKGIPAKNLPTVLLIHGGPWARDDWGYDGLAQFLANRGYAVMQPNFRGSTGYGKKFLNAGNKEWGTGYMQHDLTYGVDYLVKEGISDPKRIAIAGGSYGGYATLAGLAFTPELYACGFDIVGPSNIITLLNSIPPYWAPLKKMFAVRVGDMDIPEEKKMLEEQSPFFHAKNIVRPLFVAQGANDPRVKKAESDMIVVALRDLNRDVEYMLAPDEGHGYSGLENRVAMFYAMEKFFNKHLKGRYQEDLRPAIADRYKSLMVDIASVKLPESVQGESSSKLYDKFNGSKISDYSYSMSILVETQGQKIPMDASREVIKTEYEGKAALMVLDKTTGMMSASDTLWLDAETLIPIARRASQGPVILSVDFQDGKIVGLINMNGQKMPLDVKVDGTVLSENAGVEIPLTTLELKAGLEGTINQFDMMTAGVKTLKFKVESEEMVSIAAGDFDSYKVSLSPLESDGTAVTHWISKDKRIVVKTIASLPPMMGGGTVTSEMK